MSALSNLGATAYSGTGSQMLAAAFIAGFRLLALWLSVLVARQLHGQLSRSRRSRREPSKTMAAHGLITVARRGSPFNDDDRDVLRSLASQATLALENVELHL